MKEKLAIKTEQGLHNVVDEAIGELTNILANLNEKDAHKVALEIVFAFGATHPTLEFLMKRVRNI